MNIRSAFSVLLFFSSMQAVGYAQTTGAAACGGLAPEGSNAEGYGPYDYTNPEHRTHKLPIVERHHFNTDVESLKKGITTAPAAPDMAYTLWAFPNHHRALVSLINLAFREKSSHPKHMPWSVDCYFDRAMRFKPNDKRVPMLYGVYLMKINRPKDALKFFSAAQEGLQHDANFHYNFGLLYVQLQQWDKAADEAAAAYGGGFALPGLRNKLVSAGKWDLVEKKLKSNQATSKPQAANAPDAKAIDGKAVDAKAPHNTSALDVPAQKTSVPDIPQ
jgi:hypothetical protein